MSTWCTCCAWQHGNRCNRLTKLAAPPACMHLQMHNCCCNEQRLCCMWCTGTGKLQGNASKGAFMTSCNHAWETAQHANLCSREQVCSAGNCNLSLCKRRRVSHGTHGMNLNANGSARFHGRRNESRPRVRAHGSRCVAHCLRAPLRLRGAAALGAAGSAPEAATGATPK